MAGRNGKEGRLRVKFEWGAAELNYIPIALPFSHCARQIARSVENGNNSDGIGPHLIHNHKGQACHDDLTGHGVAARAANGREGCQVWRGFDNGAKNPFCCIWIILRDVVDDCL